MRGGDRLRGGDDRGLDSVRELLPADAAERGGRTTRSGALAALAAIELSTSRTCSGVAVAALAGLAGAALWFALAQWSLPRSSLALTVTALLLALVALAAAGLLARRVRAQAQVTRAALLRWFAVAPEVPTRVGDRLLAGPGLVRVVLAGAGVLLAVVGLVAAFVTGNVPLRAGLGLASLGCGAVAVVALLRWSRLRTVLLAAAPSSSEVFAPRWPTSSSTAPPAFGPESEIDQTRWAGPFEPAPHTSPGTVPMPAADVLAIQTGPAGPSPSGSGPSGHSTGPVPPPVSGDMTLIAPVGIVVHLADGRRLPVGPTLLGRGPQPLPEEAMVRPTVLVHGSVSKTHATLVVGSERVRVTDRASTNGTYVIEPGGARRRLSPWRPVDVGAGCEIALGEYRIRVDPA